MSHLTKYGFVFGPAEVTRLMSEPSRGVCIGVATDTRNIEIYVSPKGRSVRIFEDEKEWKAP